MFYTSIGHLFEHRHSCACDDYCDDNDDDYDDWNQYQFRIQIPNSMHFCLLPMMPHGLLTSVYVSARRLLTPFISLSNTQEGCQGRFQEKTILLSEVKIVQFFLSEVKWGIMIIPKMVSGCALQLLSPANCAVFHVRY